MSLQATRAFTLIELLVVIAIIGLLSSIALASLNTAREKARTAKSIVELRQLQTALEMYYDANGSYPNSQGGAGIWDGLHSCWGDSSANWIAGLVPTYISSLPRSPNGSSDCDDNYIYDSDGVDYKLIWHNPENCPSVGNRYPNLADPVRMSGGAPSTCWAYGFWTIGGELF